MRKALVLSLSFLLLSTALAVRNEAATPTKGTLATITGSVKDNKGNPLAGALVSLLKEGVKHAVKEARTDHDGNFIAKVIPGRYRIRAMANGFSEVVFASVDVRPSQELVYRFNLEPAGNGNTLPERRRDREDVKWTLRSAQRSRSIFQVNEGEDATVAAVTQAENEPVEVRTDESELSENSTSHSRTREYSKLILLAMPMALHTSGKTLP